MNILNKNNKGLTLIETLVAISILLMAVVGPMVIYSNSINNMRDIGDQTIAYYLAQEGVELMKYKIYTEFNNSDVWFSTLPNCNFGNSSNKCTIEIPNGDICSGGSCEVKLYLDSNNLYNHDNDGNPTKFERTIKFTNDPPLNNSPKEGTLVSSTVTWESLSGNKSVTVEEYMTKWR